MTVKIMKYTFSGDVVKNGTFTVGYPAGFTKGSFAEGKIRRFFANQKTFVAPVDFTVSFGASVATITYLGATTIKSGTQGTVEFDLPGEIALANTFQHLKVGAVNRSVTALIDLGSPLAAVTTAFISAATSTELPNTATKTYTPANIGTSPCDGSNTTWVQDVPRNLTITATHASSIVAMTINVTGTDLFNQIMSETLTVTATGTSKSVTGVKGFYTVTRVDLVAVADATANTISVGFGSALALPVYVSDVREVLAEVQDGVMIGAIGAPIRLPFYADAVDTSLGSTASPDLIAPCDGVITRLGTNVRTAISTGGTVTAAVGTTAVAGLSITIANSATKGTIQFGTPTVGDVTTVVTKDARIQVIIQDAFTGGGSVEGFIEMVPTGLKSGTLQKGLSPNTTPTAITNDVRGLYTPNATMDGTIGFLLLVNLANPSYLGSTHYHF